MSRLTKSQIEASLADATGLSADKVASLLDALAGLAYREAPNGFALPGFGEFLVTRAPGRKGINPFTGKPVTFKGKPELSFTPDTDAVEHFTADRQAPVADDSKPKRAPTVFQEVRLTVAPQQDIEPPTDWKTKLGGEPDWIQGPEEPICCGDSMTFYAQVDSDALDVFNIGDSGTLYVFACDSCSKPKAVMQCY